MNTAIYEWGDYDTVNEVVVWTDITNYVMASGDFNIIFNNYDGTLKETEFNVVINAEYDIPYGIKNKPFRIKQDGKVLFYGYIYTIIDRTVNDSETDFVIRSVLSRLSDNGELQLYSRGTFTHFAQYYNYFNQTSFLLNNNPVAYHKSTQVGKLFEFMFLNNDWYNAQQPVGTVKVEVDATALDLYCPEVIWEVLFSAGCEVTGRRRKVTEVYSWKKIVELVCMSGFILIWDIDNERFKFIYTGAKDDGVAQTIYTSPPDAKIYKVEKEALNMIRRMVITTQWQSDLTAYNLLAPGKELDSENISTLTVSDSAEALDLGEYKSVLFCNSTRDELVFLTPRPYWNRFSLMLDFFTLTTDIVTDVAGAETDYTCLFNVSSYDAKLVKGRYFGELQLFDVSTESEYDNRDALEKEFESQTSERAI